MKNTLFIKAYCIAHHDDTTSFLPACNYHIILLGEIEELLHKLYTFFFTYQDVDSLYTLCKYRFSGDILQRMELCLTMFRVQSLLTKEKEGWTKCRVLQ